MPNLNSTIDLPAKPDYERYEFDFNETAENLSFGNDSQYSDNFYEFQFDLWEHYLKPEAKEWLIMVCYLIVFIVSLVGNGLIVTYVLRRKNLQTTVNCYMLNLALADTLVTIIVLPTTVAVDVFETWPFGRAMCKFTPYLQMMVTSVSALSLGAIAINRWYVVCHPLKVSKIKNARKSAVIGMSVIWVFSSATLCPVAVVSELSSDYDDTVPELENIKSCTEVWESHQRKAAFHLYYVIMCYLSPLIVLAATYTMVFRRLRTAEIPGHCTTVRYRRECHCNNTRKGQTYVPPTSPISISSPPESPKSPPNARQEQKAFWRQQDGQPGLNNSSFPSMDDENQPLNEKIEEKVQPKIRFTRKIRKSLSLISFKKPNKDGICRRCSAMYSLKSNLLEPMGHNTALKTQRLLLQTRRKSARMQVTLIVVFGVCYAPAIILDLLRNVFSCSIFDARETNYFGFAVAHLIVYINSAVNPIIYNFFSSQFRKEFRKTFSCFFNRDLKRRISGFSSSYILSKWDQQTRRETLQTTPRMSES